MAGMTIAQALTVKLGADLSGLRRGMNQANRITRRAGQSMSVSLRNVKRAAIVLGVAVAGIAAIAIKSFATFSAEMTKVETLVGLGSQRVRQLGQEILRLAPIVGKAPVELSRALFAITSGGLTGAGALKLLAQSAKAAASGLGDTAQIGRTATAALQAFKFQNLSTERAVDILVATVRKGNLVAEELAGALGKAMGLAAAMGVTFEELNAFVATYSRLGVDAALATTSLRAALTAFLKPGDEAEKALAAIGFSVADVRRAIADPNVGLTRTMIEIIRRSREMGVNIAAIVPNVRALAGILGTAGVQAREYENVLNAIKNSTGLTNEAFKRTQLELSQIAQRIKSEVIVTFIALGQVLAPVAERVATAFREIAGHVREWVTQNQVLLQQNVTAFFEGTVRMIGALGEQLLGVVRFFRDNPLVGQFGLVGLVFLGPRGAVGAGLIGLLINNLAKDLGIVTRTALEEQRAHLDRLQRERRNLISRMQAPQIFQSTEVRDAGIDIAAARLEKLDALILQTTRTINAMKEGLGGVGGAATGAFDEALRAGERFFKALQQFTLPTGGGGQPPSPGGPASRMIGPFGAVFALGEELQRRQRLFGQPAAIGGGGPFGAFAAAGQELQRVSNILGTSGKKIQDSFSNVVSVLTTQFAGAITGVIFGLQSLNAALRSMAQTVLNTLLGTGVKAALGSIFPGLSFQHGGIVPGMRPMPILAHPGEVVLNRAAVQRLGGAQAANQLNLGGLSVTLTIDADQLPDPGDFGLPSPPAIEWLRKSLNAIKTTGYRFDTPGTRF